MKNRAWFFENEKSLITSLKTQLKNVFPGGASVVVKLHMGEPGNNYFIKASFTKQIVELLLSMDCRPVVFDTPVVYSSPRNTPEGYMKAAAGHGYTKEEIGVPIIISEKSRRLSGNLGDYGVASIPLDADGVLLLSHFKGHICSGAGGAIKNVGMGCMSKDTKGRIHNGGEPVYTDGCTQCGNCVDNCPTDNIRIDGSRPWFDLSWCSGCSNCILSCPQSCLTPKNDLFDNLLADAAVTAHSHFKKVFAVNVLRGITQLCDCMADAGPVVADDIGYVSANDMLSADIASLQLLSEKTGEEDIFKKYNKVSSWRHLRAAAKYMSRNMDIEIDRE
ncbi:MAG: DUF362 domain-containing protein [Candidatus Krumholzibacteriota bacterium]|nr:DUF362 domain-containing protein [Candidatus Krumholzibacteriota bacterium]